MPKIMRRHNGNLAFASADPEWFSLGATHDHLLTAKEVMAFTGMDAMTFTTHQVSAFVDAEHTWSYRDMPNHKAVLLEEVGTGITHPAGIVGKGREVFQFDQLVEPLQDVVDVSGGQIETAGVFDGGAEWFAFLRLPKEVTIGGDEHTMYLFGRDGLNSSLTFAPHMKRLWCLNMFPAAISAASRGEHVYRLQHRRGAKVNVAAVREAIALAYVQADELDTMAKTLMDQEVTEAEFMLYVDGLLGSPADTDDVPDFVMDRYFARNRHLMAMFVSDREQTMSTFKDGKPTAWTAFQAVSEWLDHESPVRDQHHVTSRRMERLATGRWDSTKAAALEALL